MRAPSDFQPQLVNTQYMPYAAPPTWLRSQRFPNEEAFAQADGHAIAVAQEQHDSFKDLLYHLVYSSSWSDVEALRVLFRWMTRKHMYSIEFAGTPPGSPEELIQGFKDGRSTYCRIFELMCLYSGIPCLTVVGFAKGVEFRPGMKFQSQAYNHSWNVAYVDGSWQLIDSHWATRYLQSNDSNVPENMIYEYDDFYFCPDPENFVYSHFPEDPKWQLLKQPLSMYDFEDLPVAKSAFFKNSLKFLSHHQGTVKTNAGTLNMSLGSVLPVSFTFKLLYGESCKDEVGGTKLTRFGIQETCDGQVNYFIRAPLEGFYYLTIYGTPVTHSKQESIFSAVCEYRILCDEFYPNAEPYPFVSDTNWGPGAPVYQAGLIPNCRDAVIIAHDGHVELDFEKVKPVKVLAKLQGSRASERQCEEAVKQDDNDNVCRIDIDLPVNGEYALEIYANDPQRDGNTYTHVCQYLLVKPERADNSDALFYQSPQYNDCYNVYGLKEPVQPISMSLEDLARNMEGARIADSYKNEPRPSAKTAYGVVEAISVPAVKPKPKTAAKPTIGEKPAVAAKPGKPVPKPKPKSSVSSLGADNYGSGRPGDRTSSQSVDEYGNPIKYDEYGKPISMNQYGKPVQYDEYGNPIATDEYGNPVKYDEYGKPIPMDQFGNPLLFDEYGKPIPLDQYGKPVQYDEYGNPVATDEYGNPVKYDEYGKPIPVDQYGNPLLFDEYGKPISVDKYGNPVKYDEYGNPVPVDEYGNPIKYDEYGKPIRMDKLGRPVQYDDLGHPFVIDEYGNSIPLDEYGNPIEVDRYGKPILGDAQYGDDKYHTSPGTKGSAPYSTKYSDERQPYETEQSPQNASSYSALADPSKYTSLGYAAKPYKGQGQYRDGNYSQEDLDRHAGKGEGDEFAMSGGSHRQPHHGREYSQSSLTGQEDDFPPPPPASDMLNFQFAPERRKAEIPKAPKNFEPVHIAEKQSAQFQVPKPAPPQLQDNLVFSAERAEQFKNVDTHAVQVAKTEHNSFRDLIWDLIYSKNITDDLEKARVIFLWLCTKDLNKMKFNNVQPGSPEEILLNVKQGKATYAQIYETLCSYAGLHCRVIRGYAKGADYKPGMKFLGTQAFHAWNAVVINGHWRLIDCHWASRRMFGQKGTEHIKYELDDYYFCVDPRQLIYTHFPEDKQWQLLMDMYDIHQFEDLPLVKSLFFRYCLQLETHTNAVIHADDQFSLAINYQYYRGPGLEFTFSLHTNEGEDAVDGVKLNRFGVQDTAGDGKANFWVRPPAPGSFKLAIYAREVNPGEANRMYCAVVEYMLDVHSKPSHIVPFPECSGTTWGISPASAKKHGVSTKFHSGILYTQHGQSEIRFKLAKQLLFSGKLKSNSYKEQDLQSCILYRTVGETAIFSVSVPAPGEYGLEVYVNDPAKDGKMLKHMCQYLLVCEEQQVSGIRFPQLPAAYLGPQQAYTKLGMATLSNKDPLIHNMTGEVEVSFKTSTPLRATSNLIQTTTNQDFTEYILQQFKEDTLSFQIRLPKAGIYKFQIFAQPLDDQNDSLPGVYNYLINCGSAKPEPIPYPKQFSQWKEGCYLFTPQDGDLTLAQPPQDPTPNYVFYQVLVPQASKVAVVVGGEWTHLELNNGIWEGAAYFQAGWGKETSAALTANYGSDQASYNTLLEYRM